MKINNNNTRDIIIEQIRPKFHSLNILHCMTHPS